MQAEDANGDSGQGAQVAEDAAQRMAPAGQSAHRQGRPATAVAVRKTMPPRKATMAAKSKAGPASAPPEVNLSNLLANVLSQV